MSRLCLALVAMVTACGVTDPRLDASQCGQCHTAQHAEWSASRHAESSGSPVFEALLPRVEQAWGATAKARCVACHSPRLGPDATIGCVTCHAAVGNRGEANGALVVNLDAPLAGPSASVQAPHPTAPRGFLRSASLCGTCHEVHGPGLLDEPTLTEFRATSEADGRCGECHLPPRAGAEGRDHRFVGVDPRWGASRADQLLALDAARALWARALRLEVREDAQGVVVQLQNVGAAHTVPTGAAWLREVWVDVQTVDAEGRMQPFRVLELSTRMSRDGVDVALPTDATALVPQGLPAGATRTWSVPEGLTVVEATLSTRAVRGSVLAALQLEARAAEVPVLEVARWSRSSR